MIGPEHYKAAEALLSQASLVRSKEDPTAVFPPEVQQSLIGRAQVHATLALAAATAENDGELGRNHAEYVAWRDAGAIQ